MNGDLCCNKRMNKMNEKQFMMNQNRHYIEHLDESPTLRNKMANTRQHLQVVSDKKIKMLKTPFVIAQVKYYRWHHSNFHLLTSPY